MKIPQSLKTTYSGANLHVDRFDKTEAFITITITRQNFTMEDMDELVEWVKNARKQVRKAARANQHHTLGLT